MPTVKKTKLFLCFADDTTKTVCLQKGINSIGTSPAAHIQLTDDRYASRIHAMIILDDDQLALREARSSNGVFLKVGKQPIRLQSGDELLVGSTLIKIEVDPEAGNDES